MREVRKASTLVPDGIFRNKADLKSHH